MNPLDILKICEFSDDAQVRATYSADGSIFEVMPAYVAFPKNVGELKKLVKMVAEKTAELSRLGGTEHPTLTARAAGTCMSGGSLTEGIMVDMKKGFTKISEPDMVKKQVWVESGVYYRDLEKTMLAHGLLFPPYTSSKDFCCVGGMVGNNASGEKSLRYGATVNNVVALKMVCADGEEYQFGLLTEAELEAKKSLQNFEGELYRQLSALIADNAELIATERPKVVKNAAGYGLWNVWSENGVGTSQKTFNIAKLIVGSQGTFGFVTSALLQLVDMPQHTQMVVLPVTTLSRLAEAVQEILSHGPEGLETYDSHTYDLAKVHMPAEAEYAQRAEGCNLVLFGQFAEKTAEETTAKAQECVDGLKSREFDAEMVTDKNESNAHWAIRRASYKLLKDNAPAGFVAAPTIEDTIVPIEHYGEFLAELEKIMEDYKSMTYTFAGHIGAGSIRLIPLVDSHDIKIVEEIFELSRRTYELVVKYRGSISVDHNDGIIRTPYLGLMFSEKMLALFAKTKKIFDPQGIFNPGKKVAGPVVGTVEYAKSHVTKRI